MKEYTLKWKNFRLALGRRTAVMGIVNVTPDSFSDGGQFFASEAAVAQAQRLVAAGADVIDIGGESTRPYADAVLFDEEIARVIPVIESLKNRIPVPISIDTTKAAVAEAAVAAGAAMINDISALQMDDQMAATVARLKVPVILMHMKGSPRTMQVDPQYNDLLREVHQFLENAIARATAAGIPRENIIIDPGVGFGKTLPHNLTLLRRLRFFTDMDVPILVGPSRKTFIRKLLTSATGAEPAADQPDVETGTQAAVAVSVMNGAHIVRVHNVANTRAMLSVLDAIRNADNE
jgi:dihydropteroate synthase